MRHGWEIKKLGEVCEIERGGSPRPIKEYLTDSQEGINWIKIGDADGSKYITKTKEKIKPEGIKKSRYVYSGDFLLSNSMSFGRPYILAIDGCIHDGWLVIHDTNNYFNKSYLYYYLGSSNIYQEFKRLAVGGVVNNLNTEIVKNVKVYIPPLSEQERIVAELDLLSDVIAKKREQLKQLDTLAQSIFYDMFGDPFLMSNAKESVPLGSICVINPHKSELKNIDKNTLCSFVGMAQIGENGELTLEHNRAIKDVYKGFTFFREGDVLFAKITPCMENGKGAIAKRLTNKIGFGSTEFHVIRPNNKITDKYIYYLLSIPSIRKWAESKMTGAGGQRRVPTSFFDELRIILPSLPLQQQFASKIESIEKQKELIKQSLSEVQQLFDSRMDYYFN